MYNNLHINMPVALTNELTSNNAKSITTMNQSSIESPHLNITDDIPYCSSLLLELKCTQCYLVRILNECCRRGWTASETVKEISLNDLHVYLCYTRYILYCPKSSIILLLAKLIVNKYIAIYWIYRHISTAIFYGYESIKETRNVCKALWTAIFVRSLSITSFAVHTDKQWFFFFFSNYHPSFWIGKN